MQTMALSKSEKQTCDNVRYFFKYDFKRYKQLASLADLKSIGYNGFNSSTNTNNQENKVITASYCQEVINMVKNVIERMQDERLSKILIYRHFDYLPFWQIARKLQYSESTVKQLSNQAHLLFADMLAMVTDIDLRKSDYIEKDTINRQ